MQKQESFEQSPEKPSSADQTKLSQSQFSFAADESGIGDLAEKQLVQELQIRPRERSTKIAMKALEKDYQHAKEYQEEINPEQDKTDLDQMSPPFRKFIYCRMRMYREPKSSIPQNSKTSSSSDAPKIESKKKLRKTFWIFPSQSKAVTKDEKEEIDLLTTLGFDQSFTKTSSQNLILGGDALEFVAEFWPRFNHKDLKMFMYVLNTNQHNNQPNDYNPNALRYFFGCRFTDFECKDVVAKKSGSQTSIPQSPGSKKKIVLNQSIFLFETCYPFRRVFKDCLEKIFKLVKVRRLELYGKYFNGDFSDIQNYQKIDRYDSSLMNMVNSDHDRLYQKLLDLS